MEIPEAEDQQFHDEQVQRAAAVLQTAIEEDTSRVTKAKHAFITVVGLVIANASDIENPDRALPYMQRQYRLGTNGKELPIKIESAKDWWRLVTESTSAVRILVRRQTWLPKNDELAAAIINNDSRVEIN